MTVTDRGLDFWLQYVSAEGGMHERVGDSTLVLLPEALQARHEQSEDLMVTTDPEIAREDGALLLTAGHPLLAAAAEAVLAEGDVGALRLARPSVRPPDADHLQTRVRDQLAVDHGRIDLIGGPRPAVRTILRVSSLVTYALSTDDHFQEQVECWVDIPSCLPYPDDIGGALSALLTGEHTERDQLRPDDPNLLPALAEADREISRRASKRRDLLAGNVGRSHREEVARARDYYSQVADSLRRRMTSAAADKVAAYGTRLASTDAERDRRIAEIDEKYRSAVSCLPFRLHVVGVPCMRVELDIRRGNRRYPVELDWLLALRRFAPMRCPACGSTSVLVAGKSALGCRGCQPVRMVPLTTQ
ncbi:hypothetical protein ACVBEQ_21805 [Nakamurella sp. GG22]